MLVFKVQVLYNFSLSHHSLSFQAAKSYYSFNMGSPKPYSRSVVQGIYIIPERPSKVVKRKQPPRKPSKASRQPLLKALQQSVKQKNGLLKTKIAACSDAMQMYARGKHQHRIES